MQFTYMPTVHQATVRVEFFGNVIFSVNRERRCSVERNFRYARITSLRAWLMCVNKNLHVQILRSNLLELPACIYFFLLETVIP